MDRYEVTINPSCETCVSVKYRRLRAALKSMIEAIDDGVQEVELVDHEADVVLRYDVKE